MIVNGCAATDGVVVLAAVELAALPAAAEALATAAEAEACSSSSFDLFAADCLAAYDDQAA